MLLPLYASSRAVAYRLAPAVDAIKSRDDRLHPCDGSFLGAAQGKVCVCVLRLTDVNDLLMEI